MPNYTRMKRIFLQGLLWLYLVGCGYMALSLESGFLDFDNLPDTNFTCVGKVIGGYYADLETNCQMFHVCTIGQLDEPMDIRFLCLNGTVFDQETRVCERIDEVDCAKSEHFYSLNLELYGNTQPAISEDSSDNQETEQPLIIKSTTTTSTTTSTTKRPTVKPTPPPAFYTTARAPQATTPDRQTITQHFPPVVNPGSASDIRFNPEEINISLNPGAPPDIRTNYHSQAYSDTSKNKVIVTTHSNYHEDIQKVPTLPDQRPQANPTTPSGIPHQTTSNVNFDFTFPKQIQEFQTEVPQQYHFHASGFHHSQTFPARVSHQFQSTTHKANNYQHKGPTTVRNVYLQTFKPVQVQQQHYYQRTEKPSQLPHPLLPTLPPFTFSSPAPFTLQRHIETKRYTKEHQAPPRIIISASASVSDADGRRLNYSLGTIGAGELLETPPSAYEEYKDEDVGLDPFYHDVPKLKKRSKRSTMDQINPFEIIKSEDEALDVLKFLFHWYRSHQATATAAPITVPVSSELITKINSELASQDEGTTESTKPEKENNNVGIQSEELKKNDSRSEGFVNIDDYVNDNYEPQTYNDKKESIKDIPHQISTIRTSPSPPLKNEDDKSSDSVVYTQINVLTEINDNRPDEVSSTPNTRKNGRKRGRLKRPKTATKEHVNLDATFTNLDTTQKTASSEEFVSLATTTTESGLDKSKTRRRGRLRYVDAENVDELKANHLPIRRRGRIKTTTESTVDAQLNRYVVYADQINKKVHSLVGYQVNDLLLESVNAENTDQPKSNVTNVTYSSKDISTRGDTTTLEISTIQEQKVDEVTEGNLLSTHQASRDIAKDNVKSINVRQHQSSNSNEVQRNSEKASQDTTESKKKWEEVKETTTLKESLNSTEAQKDSRTVEDYSHRSATKKSDPSNTTPELVIIEIPSENNIKNVTSTEEAKDENDEILNVAENNSSVEFSTRKPIKEEEEHRFDIISRDTEEEINVETTTSIEDSKITSHTDYDDFKSLLDQRVIDDREILRHSGNNSNISRGTAKQQMVDNDATSPVLEEATRKDLKHPKTTVSYEDSVEYKHTSDYEDNFKKEEETIEMPEIVKSKYEDITVANTRNKLPLEFIEQATPSRTKGVEQSTVQAKYDVSVADTTLKLHSSTITQADIHRLENEYEQPASDYENIDIPINLPSSTVAQSDIFRVTKEVEKTTPDFDSVHTKYGDNVAEVVVNTTTPRVSQLDISRLTKEVEKTIPDFQAAHTKRDGNIADVEIDTPSSTVSQSDISRLAHKLIKTLHDFEIVDAKHDDNVADTAVNTPSSTVAQLDTPRSTKEVEQTTEMFYNKHGEKLYDIAVNIPSSTVNQSDISRPAKENEQVFTHDFEIANKVAYSADNAPSPAATQPDIQPKEVEQSTRTTGFARTGSSIVDTVSSSVITSSTASSLAEDNPRKSRRRNGSRSRNYIENNEKRQNQPEYKTKRRRNRQRSRNRSRSENMHPVNELVQNTEFSIAPSSTYATPIPPVDGRIINLLLEDAHKTIKTEILDYTYPPETQESVRNITNDFKDTYYSGNNISEITVTPVAVKTEEFDQHLETTTRKTFSSDKNTSEKAKRIEGSHYIPPLIHDIEPNISHIDILPIYYRIRDSKEIISSTTDSILSTHLDDVQNENMTDGNENIRTEPFSELIESATIENQPREHIFIKPEDKIKLLNNLAYVNLGGSSPVVDTTQTTPISYYRVNNIDTTPAPSTESVTYSNEITPILTENSLPKSEYYSSTKSYEAEAFTSAPLSNIGDSLRKATTLSNIQPHEPFTSAILKTQHDEEKTVSKNSVFSTTSRHYKETISQESTSQPESTMFDDLQLTIHKNFIDNVQVNATVLSKENSDTIVPTERDHILEQNIERYNVPKIADASLKEIETSTQPVADTSLFVPKLENLEKFIQEVEVTTGSVVTKKPSLETTSDPSKEIATTSEHSISSTASENGNFGTINPTTDSSEENTSEVALSTSTSRTPRRRTRPSRRRQDRDRNAANSEAVSPRQRQERRRGHSDNIEKRVDSSVNKERNTDAPLYRSVNPTQSETRKGALSTTPLSRSKLQKDNKFFFNCFGKEINKFYPDPRDCRLFHYCTRGYSKNQLLDMKFVCDLKTYFDDEKLICTKVKPRRCL